MGRPDDAGEDAAYGTVCHSITEEALRTDRFPSYLLGTRASAEAGGKTWEFVIDEEMLDYCRECVAWVKDIPGDKFVETKVDFSDLTPIPKQKGTADLAFCQPGKLVIRDWKFGKGVQVFVCDDGYDALDPRRHEHLNSQVFLYAYGFFRLYDWEYDFREIDVGIGQPRLDHWQTITIGRDELLAFAAWIKERATLAWEHDAPRTPSLKACRWCRDRSCGAVAEQQRRMLQGRFRDLSEPVTVEEMAARGNNVPAGSRMPSAAEMTTEELVAALSYRKMFESAFEKMERELEHRALQGEEVPGHKIVLGRKNRDWIDEAETEGFLHGLGLRFAEIWKAELLSPAAVEELLKARFQIGKKAAEQKVAHLIHRPEGRPTLVPATDRRPAVGTSIRDRFRPVDDI
jgi:hypothetical protein